MRILITGARGQLGQELVKVFENSEVIASDNDTLDITNFSQVKEFVKDKKPDWIINCAAYTDVDGCAKDPEKANLINGEGPKNLATAAKEIGAKLLQISTNEVFDGTKETPYVETDQVNPINAYAKSKVLGERNCLEILGKSCLIARTAWLYGPASTRSFPNKIIALAKEKGKLSVVADEYGNPTYAPDLAGWIKDLVEKEKTGVFHLVNNGSCSRFEWAKEILKEKQIKTTLEKIKLKDFSKKIKTLSLKYSKVKPLFKIKIFAKSKATFLRD